MKIIKQIYIVTLCVTIIIVFLYVLKGKIQIPRSFEIGGLDFNLYGLIIGLAILVVIDQIGKHAKYINKDDLWLGLIWVLIPAIFFARLWHVFTDYHEYRNNIYDIFLIWKGGLGIFGGIFGGSLGLYLFCKKTNVPFIKTLDYLSLFLPLGQVLGRFGNFINQEIFGPPTNLPWGMYIKPENRPLEYLNSQYFHPAFLYEIAGNVMIFVILYTIFKRKGIRGDGFFTILYLFGYSTLRFIVEFFRLDPKIIGIFSVGQITSIFIIIISSIIICFYLQNYQNERKS